jgi:sulfide:quinone oxidoreductase
MTAPTRSHPFRVLIAGGGVAALEALLALRHLAEDRVSIELIACEPQFWYRPLAVAEPFKLARVRGLDLSDLADQCGAGLTLGAVESVDAERHRVRTVVGAEFEYDVLLIAIGARPVPAVPGALTFRGPADTHTFSALLADLEREAARSVAFALPGTVGWPLPVYELALQTAGLLVRRGADVRVVLVTPEESPLHLFGPTASAAVSDLLADRGIELRLGSYPVAFANGSLSLTPGESVAVDRVVALPRLEGVRIMGIPQDADGFISIDDHARVRDVADVFAAGDATAFPIKQGGLAAQQADAAAESIAAAAGVEIQPRAFHPVLRGLILTGGPALFARADLAGVDEPSLSGTEPLWWPPGKIVGHYLAPFLAERSGAILSPPVDAGVAVDVELTSLGAA